MEKGKTKSSRSAMWRPKSNDGFELVFSGYGSDSTCSSQFLDRRPGVETQWYVIKVPYPDSNPDPDPEPEPEPDFVSYFTSSKPKKAKAVHHPGRFNPISVADHLYENKHSAVLARTHLYSFGNVRSSIDVDCLIPHKEVSTLDVNCVADGWKFVPPMASPRYCPHTVVLDGKLYVLGGFETASSLRGSGWMEVFDPNTKKWTSLPNPPTEISEHEMIYGVVEPKKMIFLSDLRYPYAFQTYDVKSKAWTARRSAYPFEIFSNGVHPRATTVGNTLFWVSLVWDSFENLDGCCVHAYRMDDGSDSGDVYFKGSFDIDRMVELDNGVTAKYPPGGLHHLGDHKFCFLLTTLNYEHGKTSSYVNCLILDISPTCDEDGEGHNKLNISILSNHKYSVPSYFTLLDSLLLNGGLYTSKKKNPKLSNETSVMFTSSQDEPQRSHIDDNNNILKNTKDAIITLQGVLEGKHDQIIDETLHQYKVSSDIWWSSLYKKIEGLVAMSKLAHDRRQQSEYEF